MPLSRRDTWKAALSVPLPGLWQCKRACAAKVCVAVGSRSVFLSGQAAKKNYEHPQRVSPDTHACSRIRTSEPGYAISQRLQVPICSFEVPPTPPAWGLRRDASGLVRVKSGVSLMATGRGAKIMWDCLLLGSESGISGDRQSLLLQIDFPGFTAFSRATAPWRVYSFSKEILDNKEYL